MKPLPIGSPAPDFTLLNEVGRPVTMSGLVKRGKVLLIFYPSDWGFVCRQEVMTFRDMQSDFERAGYQLVGISFNDTVSHGLWSEHLKLRFPLLSDRMGAVSTSYGVWDDKEESFNKGRPERALIMVSQSMIVSWVWVSDNPWFEPDYDEVLRVAQDEKPVGYT